MRKPPRRLVESTYLGNFYRVPANEREGLWDFTITYRHLSNTGYMRLRFTKEESDFRKKIQAAIQLNMTYAGWSCSGGPTEYSTEIPSATCTNADERVRVLLGNVLLGISISSFPERFQMTVQREYEVRICVGGGTPTWVPEGEWFASRVFLPSF